MNETQSKVLLLVLAVIGFLGLVVQLILMHAKIRNYELAQFGATMNSSQRCKDMCNKNVQVYGLMVDADASLRLNTTTTPDYDAYTGGSVPEQTFILPHVCPPSTIKGVEVLCRQVFLLVVHRTPGSIRLIEDDITGHPQFFMVVNGITFLAARDKARRIRLEAQDAARYRDRDVIHLYAIKSRRNTAATEVGCVMNLIPFVGTLSDNPPETASDMLTYLGCRNASQCLVHTIGFHTNVA